MTFSSYYLDSITETTKKRSNDRVIIKLKIVKLFT